MSSPEKPERTAPIAKIADSAVRMRSSVMTRLLSSRRIDLGRKLVFGSTPIGPAEMTKKLWAYVKRRKLAGKR